MKKEERVKALLAKERYSFEDLVDIMTLLRGDGGCPWDREQTHKSIRNNLIEETYEVIEAIDTESPELMCEELGDVLLQIVFHADMAKEEGTFEIGDVTDEICKKLIHRHPHVFGDLVAETSGKVLEAWEAIKSEEKSRKTVTDKLASIPHMFPALMRATKVGKKAACFDFPDAESVMDKISEEFVEVSEAMASGDKDAMAEEIGDLLLGITSLCRKLDIDAEKALCDATDKFIERFSKVEEAVLAEGKDISQCDIYELDAIWEQNKSKK